MITVKFGFTIAIASYISAWFALVNQDYGFALTYAIVGFLLWMISLELRELIND